MAKNGGKIPQTIFGRTGRILLSGAKIAAHEMVGRLGKGDSMLATKLRQTEELVATLSQLKGAAMKAGQIASLEFSEFLPPEVLAILRQLHDQSTFMPIDQVRYILSRELGSSKLSDLEGLTSTPIAAASIGQVHRAVLGGQDVVVKVQFPGVAKSIDSDIQVVQRLVRIWQKSQGKDMEMDAFFAAMADGFKREANYHLEAQHCLDYREALERANCGTSYIVPTIFNDFSTERVLTMSYESGMRLHDWIKSAPPPPAVDDFATLVIRLLITEFLTTGLMQTDPNFGNFLYRPASNTLVLLDFGATEVYPAAFRRSLQQMMRCAIGGDFNQLVELIYAEGLLDRRESAQTLEKLRHLIDHVIHIMHPAHQPFDFSNADWIKGFREATLALVRSIQFTAPSQSFTFLNRKLGGMYHLLKELKAAVDMRQFYETIEQTI